MALSGYPGWFMTWAISEHSKWQRGFFGCALSGFSGVRTLLLTREALCNTFLLQM